MSVMGYGIGDAFEIPNDQATKEIAKLLTSNEEVKKAFKLVRDMLIFTDRRLLCVDKQGMGTKVEYLTIPYKSIEMFALETAGVMERDSEISLWIKGHNQPKKFAFRRGSDVEAVYKIIGEVCLR
jgi:hypothetical protein